MCGLDLLRARGRRAAGCSGFLGGGPQGPELRGAALQRAGLCRLAVPGCGGGGPPPGGPDTGSVEPPPSAGHPHAWIDIHAFTLRLPRSFHQWLHSGGSPGGQWNAAWRQFRRENFEANQEQIWHFAFELMARFKVNELPLVPYYCDQGRWQGNHACATSLSKRMSLRAPRVSLTACTNGRSRVLIPVPPANPPGVTTPERTLQWI
jgi:hypothetical protein